MVFCTATTITKSNAQMKRAYFGMQCFWGAESTFAKLAGVRRTRVGYAGGQTLDPTYTNIGDHTEVTELQYDERICTFYELCRWFFANHDATVARKRQYQSIIIYVDEEQRKVAECSIREEQEKHNKNKNDDGRLVVTCLQRLDRFYQAEDYHQKYWLRCQRHILKELKLSDAELLDTVLAAKLNAYLAGYKDFAELKRLTADHRLSDQLVRAIEAIAIAGGDSRVCH